MSFLKKKDSDSTNHQVLFVDNNVATLETVFQIAQGKIETDRHMLPEEDAVRLYNESTGGILYVYNLDVPAKIEAENLKNLRRSAVLGKLFNYDREKKTGLLTWMPWIIVILLILFHK